MSSLNIPYSWFHAISYNDGKADLPAIVILAEIVSRYYQQGNEIQTSYTELCSQFSLTKRQVKDSINHLLEIGVIWRQFRTIADPDTGLMVGNVMFLGLIKDFEGFVKAKPKVAAEPKSKSGFIYIIEHQGVHKIGIARNVLNRIKTIKLPHEVKVIKTIITNNMLFAERQLHERFEGKRLNGEWFQLDHDDLQWLCAIERLDDEVKR